MTSDTILRAQDLTKEFMGFRAVAGVDLCVRKGSIHALIGPNGAGKTTVFNLLTRTISPTRGRIYFKDRDITSLKEAAVARLGMVRSFQISATFNNLTVLQNVRVALQARRRDCYNFWAAEEKLNEVNDRARELLQDVGLDEHVSTIAAELPYGRKRALEIATTLALDPEVLLLDEPTQGMGHEDVARVVELIRRIAVNRTVLMVEHNLTVVQSLCDRITVLQRGEVIAEGDYATVSRDARVLEAYIGGHA